MIRWQINKEVTKIIKFYTKCRYEIHILYFDQLHFLYGIPINDSTNGHYEIGKPRYEKHREKWVPGNYEERRSLNHFF